MGLQLGQRVEIRSTSDTFRLIEQAALSRTENNHERYPISAALRENARALEVDAYGAPLDAETDRANGRWLRALRDRFGEGQRAFVERLSRKLHEGITLGSGYVVALREDHVILSDEPVLLDPRPAYNDPRWIRWSDADVRTAGALAVRLEVELIDPALRRWRAVMVDALGVRSAIGEGQLGEIENLAFGLIESSTRSPEREEAKTAPEITLPPRPADEVRIFCKATDVSSLRSLTRGSAFPHLGVYPARQGGRAHVVAIDQAEIFLADVEMEGVLAEPVIISIDDLAKLDETSLAPLRLRWGMNGPEILHRDGEATLLDTSGSLPDYRMQIPRRVRRSVGIIPEDFLDAARNLPDEVDVIGLRYEEGRMEIDGWDGARLAGVATLRHPPRQLFDVPISGRTVRIVAAHDPTRFKSDPALFGLLSREVIENAARRAGEELLWIGADSPSAPFVIFGAP